MILSIKDFVTWRINWNDKYKNIIDMTKELNLGLESVVFWDDNPLKGITQDQWSRKYTQLKCLNQFITGRTL